MHRDIWIGMKVICSETEVVGTVTKFYNPTASEEQTMVKTEDGRDYHAPTRMWKPYQEGLKSNVPICDELAFLKSNPNLLRDPELLIITHEKMLNPFGQYVMKFAENHGISVSDAYNSPMCKARMFYHSQTGK